MTTTERGFTIIEVMLFLGITGALFAALMIGVNAGVTQQRYLDSVRSYKSLLQDQYASALNVRNQDVSDKACNTETWTVGDGQRGNWGASDCVILGRAIQVTNSGQTVQTSSVIGHLSDTTSVDNLRDIDAIAAYKPSISDFDLQSTDIDWGSSLTLPQDNPGGSVVKSSALILVLRSPVSGVLYTFWSATKPGSLLDMLDSSHATQPLKNCISNETRGMLPTQMVIINPTVASADAVSVDGGNGNDTGCQ